MINVNIANNYKDMLSRQFEYLRISVTDRCNYRCSYCMPAEIFNKDYSYIKQNKILSAAGLLKEGSDVSELFKSIDSKIVNLETG